MTENDRIYGEELHRNFKLWRYTNAMYENWSKKYGYSCNEILVLNTISKTPDCTQKFISDWLKISKQTINMILKRFENDGLAVMETSAQDKRSKVITLTEKGEKVTRDLIDDLIDVQSEAIKTFGLDSFRTMNDIQEKYLNEFTKIAEL